MGHFQSLLSVTSLLINYSNKLETLFYEWDHDVNFPELGYVCVFNRLNY